jgi:subtilisin family serine protease
MAACLMLMLALPLFNFITARGEEGPSELEKKLLDLAAKNRGISTDDLEIISSAIVRLPLTKTEAATGKLHRTDTDEVISIAMDENGKETDLKALRKAEGDLYRAKYGKLDPFLYDLIRALRPSDKVKVAFWLNLKEDLDAKDAREDKDDLSKEEVERLIAARQEQLRKATSDATKSLKSYLGKKRIKVEEASLIAPVVYTTVTVKTLATLARRADVRRIYYAENINEDYMDIAARAVRADQVWNTHSESGEGVKIAIVEDSRVDFDNTCLVNDLGTRVPGDANVDNHATATAGMAASNDSTFRGIAFGAGIYSANGTDYSDANMSAALDAGSTNAHILNNSWGPQCGSADGSMNVHARHADYIVRYGWDTVVAAAGNNGNCAGFEFVGGVATGFNVIAVGNYDDSGTEDHSDDAMSGSSSFEDPTSAHGDRQKPEVAAPGTLITSLLMAPSGECRTGLAGSGSGTSFSSPIVAGEAALIMSARPSLKLFPEAVKALALAGATDNIEGSARLSEKDGAGGINALTAVTSAINRRYDWMIVRPSSFNSSGYIEVPLGFAFAGNRIKVALVWDSNPSGATDDFDTDTLEADLDLNVRGPGVSRWSASFDNSYEIVDFTTSRAGVYKLRIYNYRFDGAKEYVAVAWNRGFIEFPFLP